MEVKKFELIHKKGTASFYDLVATAEDGKRYKYESGSMIFLIEGWHEIEEPKTNKD